MKYNIVGFIRLNVAGNLLGVKKNLIYIYINRNSKEKINTTRIS